jgi:hypothetical protein
MFALNSGINGTPENIPPILRPRNSRCKSKYGK